MSEETFLLITTVIGAFLAGVFYGVAPLICAIVRKKIWMGLLSQLLCIVCALCMPLVFEEPISWTVLLAALLSVLICFITRKKSKS